MKIIGIEGMTTNDVDFELRLGAKFVIYSYCISLIAVSFKRSSDIYFVKKNEGITPAAIKFSLISLFLGIWGIPFGIIWSIMCIVTNLRGGKDVTSQVVASLKPKTQQQAYTTTAQPSQPF